VSKPIIVHEQFTSLLIVFSPPEKIVFLRKRSYMYVGGPRRRCAVVVASCFICVCHHAFPMVAGLYLNLDHVMLAFSLPLDHYRFSSTL
jgi:hypothetical protein